jgi:hypothetical protein
MLFVKELAVRDEEPALAPAVVREEPASAATRRVKPSARVSFGYLQRR